MADLTLTEELLLVALDDEKGADTANWGSGIEAGLAGALLLELATAGCVTHEDGKLVPVRCAPPAGPLAAEALDVIRADDRRRDAKAWIGRLPKALKPLRRRVAQRLVERGVLEERRHRRLGLFATTRFPERDPEPERRLREALTGVLAAGREPTPHEAMLIALLSAYDLVKRVVPRGERRAAGKRAKQIAEGDVIGDAVARTVRDVQMATIVAVSAATSAAAISSSGGS